MQIHAVHALSEYRPYKLAGYHTCMHVVATQTELPTEGSVICNTSVTDFESCTCDERYLHAMDLHFDYNDAHCNINVLLNTMWIAALKNQ